MASLSKIIDLHSHPILAFGEGAPVGSICEFGVSRPDLAEVHTPLAKTLRDASRARNIEKRRKL